MKEKLKKWIMTPGWSWVWINAALMVMWILDFKMTGRLWTLGMAALAAVGGVCEFISIRRSQERKNEEND